MEIILLGTGSSLGVPIIGCKCKVCTSNNSKNFRTRASILIKNKHSSILVDTSPELRLQALNNKVDRLNAVIYTHFHADHVNGIDDLRAFNFHNNKVMPVYSDAETIQKLKKAFPHSFPLHHPQDGWYKPALVANVIQANEIINIEGTEILFFNQIHGHGTSLGLKIENFAYSTDLNDLSPESLDLLKGIDIWIIDCLGYKVSRSHLSLEKALSFNEVIKPKKAILTHMNHEIDYEEISQKLPKNVIPGYDGMIINI